MLYTNASQVNNIFYSNIFCKVPPALATKRRRRQIDDFDACVDEP